LAYLEKRDYKNAITEAIRLDPQFAEAYHLRGKSYAADGENDHAILDYSEAIRLGVDSRGAYYDRAVSYLHKHQYEEAIADCNTAINPESACCNQLQLFDL
jgi:tetratricopeptide (TPR) repeat protein